MLKQASLLILIMATACAQPGVTPNQPESQFKITAAAHWHNLADRTAQKLAMSLDAVEEIDPATHAIDAANMLSTPKIGDRPFYINAQEADAPFAKTFTPLLREAIQKNGSTVKLHPQNAVVVNYTAQTFYYGGEGYTRRPLDYATLSTTPAALAIWGVDSSWGRSEIGTAVAIAGPVLDALVAMGEITNAEVVLTVSVVGAEQVLYEDSEVFYVNPADLPFYWSRYASTPPQDTMLMGQGKLKERTIYVQGE